MMGCTIVIPCWIVSTVFQIIIPAVIGGLLGNALFRWQERRRR